MIAVYSWSEQSDDGLDWWNALMWMASVKWAKRHFSKVQLMASNEFMQDLYNLGIEFDSYAEIETIDSRLKHVYEIPKLLALKNALEPIICIDHDAFVRRPLPDRVWNAAAVAEFRYAVNQWQIDLNASMPHPRLKAPISAVCTGLLGGNDVEQLRKFAIRSLESIATNADWATTQSGYQAATIIGEVPAGTELEGMECLCESTTASYRKEGFIHIAGGKRDSGKLALLAQKLHLDFPRETAKLWKLYSQLTK